jgi:hypothetical protein
MANAVIESHHLVVRQIDNSGGFFSYFTNLHEMPFMTARPSSTNTIFDVMGMTLTQVTSSIDHTAAVQWGLAVRRANDPTYFNIEPKRVSGYSGAQT